MIKQLQANDVPVLAPPNPLRGLAHDAEHIASYVNQIDGPVLLVGHSYGGAVISVAGAKTPNAVGLVYVAAFALDEGESFGEIFGRFGETLLVGAVRPSNYPLDNGETAVELTIAPEHYRTRCGRCRLDGGAASIARRLPKRTGSAPTPPSSKPLG